MKSASTPLTNPKVFISYSHDSQEHKDRVLSLSDRLRREGIDCNVDQYEQSPSRGWQQWRLDEIEQADFVLLICTELYNQRFLGKESTTLAKGVAWEGSIIFNELYQAQTDNSKFIPVLFSSKDEKFIPAPLQNVTNYTLDTEEGYESLYRHLTHQLLNEKPPLGLLKPLPPKERHQPSQPKRLCNLPHRKHKNLIGRNLEIRELLKRIHPNYRLHMNVVAGIGGVGKTALVLEAAYRCLEAAQNPSPPRNVPTFEAIIFTSSKATDFADTYMVERPQKEPTLSDIFRVIAETLNEPIITQVPDNKQEAQVYKVLAKQSTLLILDNLETLTEQERREVIRFLNNVPVSTQVVITTREDIGFDTIHLKELTRKDSLSLIATQAKSKRIKITESQKQEIHKKFGGIPISLIYAIGQRATGGYRFADILKPTVQLPEDLGKFCFESSVTPLRGTSAHRLLMAMTFFRSSPHREALATVAGLGGASNNREVTDGLAKLQRLSLIAEEADGRYSILPFTHQYALYEFDNHTDARFQNSARQYWLDWCLEFTKRYGGDDWEDWRSRYDKLEEQWRNIESALYHYQSQANWRQVLELWEQIDNYVDLNRYWNKRRHWWDLLSKNIADVGIKVKALSEKAWTLVLMGDEYYSEAQKCLDTAWKQGRTAPLVVQADIANHLAVLEKGRNNHARAQQWLEREREILDNCQLPQRQKIRHQIQNLYYQAELNQISGNNQLAKAQFEEVIELCQQVKWERFRNYAQNNLADVLIADNELEKAQTILLEGLFFAEGMKEHRRIALYHASYACLYYQLARQPEYNELQEQKKELLIKAQEYASKAVAVFKNEWMKVEQQQIEKLQQEIEKSQQEIEESQQKINESKSQIESANLRTD